MNTFIVLLYNRGKKLYKENTSYNNYNQHRTVFFMGKCKRYIYQPSVTTNRVEMHKID